LSDERAAAQLAREMEEADWRREAEDALLATDLARNPTQGEMSQDFGINGTGHGGYMGSFPAMVVHHSSALTPCSTLGDPISEQQPQHSMTFLNSNPQFGGSGSDRPNPMSRSDRFISDSDDAYCVARFWRRCSIRPILFSKVSAANSSFSSK